ncbi:dTDP-4-dehydrorhamnose 3,5-epimerase family protein [Rheinheimera marina]|uniref:dTDP-4-dehydrorhamnose 3,5-epimerase n=1 Tax=Rheinheimera marina TaxID=1774958 RepID=A0ABV9JRQ2_9GAMM
MGNKLTASETALAGVVQIRSQANQDSRGSFSRWFCQQELESFLPGQQIVQVNHSFSRQQGTVRGLHFQLPPFAEYKLVRCIAGRVFDVAVDLRANSVTFLQAVSVELSAEENNMLLIPPGCAHGFQTLTADAQLLYLHSAFYQPQAEAGFRFDDPRLKIEWPLPITSMSERDLQLPVIPQQFHGISL